MTYAECEKYSFRSVCGFFNIPRKCGEMGPPVLSSLSEEITLQALNILMFLKTLSL